MSRHSKFTASTTPIQDVYLLKRKQFLDDRGVFERMFCDEELAQYGFGGPIRQINRSLTKKQGMIRGLHFQTSPNEENKLITCTRGKVFDVALDLRVGSKSYGVCHGVILSADEALSYLIPAGCAHGFQALVDDCELIYAHDAYHAPKSERGVHPLDSELAIEWPLKASLLSQRDQALPSFKDYVSEPAS